MTPSYGIGGIGASYPSDPYFMYALNSYNPNFMAVQQLPQSVQPSQTVSVPQSIEAPAFEGSDISSVESCSNESSNTGLLVGGTIVAGAATLFYAARKGNGKGIKEGFRNIFKGFTGKKDVQENVKETVSKIRAAVNQDGKLVYTIPGKNKVLYGSNEAQIYAAKYGIDLKQLSGFNSEKSKLTGYQFKINDGGIDNIVTVKDGKVADITNGTKSIKEILESTKADDIRFVDEINKQIAKIEKGIGGNFSAYKGLTNIEYQTKIGDDIVKMTRKSLAERPQINELTTLERFGQDSQALKAYMYNNPEAKKVFMSEQLAKGKLPEGLKIESFEYKFNKNIKCHYKDNNLVGITSGGKYYPKGTETCDAFLADNETILQKAVEKMFKDGKIPKDINARLVEV